MNYAEKILTTLDSHLDSEIELTLYGRAAFLLGFENPRPEFSQSLDVDAILWLGQAEELADKSNFWIALELTNRDLESAGLYMTHLFVEEQVILTRDWKDKRVPIPQFCAKITLRRLSDEDLFLSKLMRDDPQDRQDASYISDRNDWKSPDLERIIASARVPAIPELQDEFAIACEKILELARDPRSG